MLIHRRGKPVAVLQPLEGTPNGDRVLEAITDAGVATAWPSGSDVAIAAITAAELLNGAHLSAARQRSKRSEWVARMLAVIPVEPYDLSVARIHAHLLAHTAKTGRQRSSHDLMVAATALAHHRAVLTTGKALQAFPG